VGWLVVVMLDAVMEVDGSGVQVVVVFASELWDPRSVSLLPVRVTFVRRGSVGRSTVE